eukprot:scaffold209304_cov32-Tisochrysis_lutea.AAC.4
MLSTRCAVSLDYLPVYTMLLFANDRSSCKSPAAPLRAPPASVGNKFYHYSLLATLPASGEGDHSGQGRCFQH